MIEKTQIRMIELGIQGEIIEHLETDGTHSDVIAKVLNISLDHIVKCLILNTNKGQLVATLILGNQVVDFKKLEKITRMKNFHLAHEKQINRKIGYSIGGIPPTAVINKIPVFIDEEIMKKEYIISSAGTPFHGLKLNPEVFRKFNLVISDIHKI